MTNPIPEGVSTVSPYLLVTDVQASIDFLQSVFRAEVDHVLLDDEEKPNHAQVNVGGCTIMMGKSGPDFQMAGMIHVYVQDCDATFKRALENGATEIMPPSDQFYGDRAAGVTGPFGNAWWIASQIEKYSTEELQQKSIEEHRRRKAEQG